MGLSSSQARLLNLTSRMHQIEYKAAKLESEKLQMANESNRVYEEYLEALEKTKIQRKILTTDGSVTYRDIKSYTDFLEAGFALQYNGKTYTQAGTSTDGIGALAAVSPYETDGKTVKTEYRKAGTTELDPDKLTFNNLLYDLGITQTSGNFEDLITNIINSGQVTIVANKTEIGATNVTKDFLQPTDEGYHIFETSVATNTNLQEVTDTSLLKKAEAKYESDMKKIDLKDRKYDSDLAALDAERNAIKQEMETLKTVAKENVERTFKLFS